MWCRVAVLGLLALTTAFGQNLGTPNASPKISAHLIECYKNESIYHRANRLPMTLPTFLDLVRQIENSQSGRNMNAREIAANLIFHLKMDGIEPSPGTQHSSPDVVPFGPFGQDYFRHRVNLVQLLSRPSQDYQWLTENLSTKEMCNLHFMLSYSMDAIKRPDENCGNINQESLNVRGGRYYRDTLEKVQEGSKEEEDKNAQVEVIPPDVVVQNEVQVVNDSEKGDFQIGRHDSLTFPLESPMRGGIRAQRMPQNSGGRIYTQPFERSLCPVENGVIQTPYGSLTIGTVVSGILAGLQRQKVKPSIFGVSNDEIRPDIATSNVDNLWAATLTGDVANMIMQQSFNDDTASGIGGKGGWNNSADPKWYLLQKDSPSQVTDAKLRGSLDGLWLGSVVKDWTSKSSNLKLSQILDLYYSPMPTFGDNVVACQRISEFNKYASDTEFRTQLELFSIVLQRQIVKPSTITDFSSLTSQAVGNVKDYINQLTSNTACQQRADIGGTSTPPTDFKTQLAIVIDSNWPYDALFPVLTELSKNGVVASPYSSNTTVFCGMDGSVLMTAQDSVTFARDLNTTTLNRCARGLNMGTVFYSLKVHFRSLYQNEKNLDKVQKGSHVVLFMPYSQSSVQQNSSSDKQTFKVNMPDVKFLVATNGPKDSFSSIVDNVQTDAFTIRVPTQNDPSAIEQIKAVATAIQSVPARLSLPKCASYWAEGWGKGVLVDDIPVGYTKFYRLHPNYFHKSEGTPKISVRGMSSTELVVCISRKNPNPTGSAPDSGVTTPGYNTNNYNPNGNNPYNPNNNPNSNNPSNGYNGYNNYNNRYGRPSYYNARLTSSDANCKSINTATTDFYMTENPCNGLYIYECDPLYISVTAPLKNSPPTGNCQNCRFPTNAQYEVAIDGLSCDSGVGQLLSNPIAMLIATFSIIAASFL